MLVAALMLNVIILVPVTLGLLSSGGGMDAPFGPDTDARRILTCIYGAILLVSLGLIGLHMADHPQAAAMTFALFAVQIIYKLGTVALVGLASPVVLTNLFVVVVQIAVIAVTLATR